MFRYIRANDDIDNVVSLMDEYIDLGPTESYVGDGWRLATKYFDGEPYTDIRLNGHLVAFDYLNKLYLLDIDGAAGKVLRHLADYRYFGYSIDCTDGIPDRFMTVAHSTMTDESYYLIANEASIAKEALSEFIKSVTLEDDADYLGEQFAEWCNKNGVQLCDDYSLLPHGIVLTYKRSGVPDEVYFSPEVVGTWTSRF